MIFEIRQKIFSFSDKFAIKDEMGNEKFFVNGKLLSIGKKLTLEDELGSELFYIEQKIFRLLPEYHIYCQGQDIATVKKEFTFFKPSFNIQSVYGDFSISGNVVAHNFEISKNGLVIAQVSKKWVSLSDTYGVNIMENENIPFILSLVIVLDMTLYENNHKQD